MSAEINYDDEHLDGLLGKSDSDPEEDEISAGTEEPDETAEESEHDTDDATEPGASDDAPESGDDKAAKGDSDSDPVAAEKRRADGLQREIAKLREDLRTERLKRGHEMQSPLPTAPQAPLTPAEQKKAKAKGIPVVVSDDGQSVYVDPDALNQTVEERARALFEEARRPTPDQIHMMRQHQAVQSFIAEDPERNAPAYQRAQEAEEFIGLLGQKAAIEHGIQYQTADDVVTVLRQTGLDAQITEQFPELEHMLDEFIAAAASRQPRWQRSIYERMASYASPPKAGSPAPLRDVSKGPESLARKAGGRTAPESTLEREFDALERQFRKDPVGFDEKKYTRMQALGVQLERPGFV